VNGIGPNRPSARSDHAATRGPSRASLGPRKNRISTKQPRAYASGKICSPLGCTRPYMDGSGGRPGDSSHARAPGICPLSVVALLGAWRMVYGARMRSCSPTTIPAPPPSVGPPSADDSRSEGTMSTRQAGRGSRHGPWEQESQGLTRRISRQVKQRHHRQVELLSPDTRKETDRTNAQGDNQNQPTTPWTLA
jgi:hypothetical protein